VTLCNQRDGNPFPVNAGPGFLAWFVPSVGNVSLIDLGGGATPALCENPGFVRASFDGRLYVQCSGNFSGSDAGRSIVEVDPLSNTVTRRATVPDGRVPNGVAVTANRIWTGDALSTGVFAFDKSTFAADPVQPVTLDCPKNVFNYIPDVMAIKGGFYALCASDVAGVLYRLDPDTGAVLGSVSVGPNPTELAGLDDGRIAVAVAGDNSLTLVTVNGNTLTAQTRVVTFSGDNAALQDVRAFGPFLFTVASGNNTAQRIDVNAQGGPKIVGEASFGTGAGPWNILPLDDTQAIVSNRGTNSIAAASWVTAK
jgi:hypothetical protein